METEGTDGQSDYRTELLQWIADNSVGDLASIGGLVIALVGFALTIRNVHMARKAAIRAEEAANEARKSFQTFETVADFSAAITTFEEIKRLHRQSAWNILPDRYAALKKILVALRVRYSALTDEQKTLIQSAIQRLTELEEVVDRADESGKPPSGVSGLNAIMSQYVDGLQEMLIQLKGNLNDL